MKKINKKIAYIANIITVFNDNGIITTVETEGITVITNTPELKALALQLINDMTLHSLTYQINETSGNIELFDSRV